MKLASNINHKISKPDWSNCWFFFFVYVPIEYRDVSRYRSNSRVQSGAFENGNHFYDILFFSYNMCLKKQCLQLCAVFVIQWGMRGGVYFKDEYVY